jgi:Protein of unknown function (DUF3627)/MSV199 domain
MDHIKNISDVYANYETQLKIKDNMIKRAIDASYNMLTLEAFIEATELKMPDIMELNNIRCYKANIPVLFNEKLIEAFGYSGTIQKQKQNLIKLINSHKLPYLLLDNDGYDKFITYTPKGIRKDGINFNLTEDLYPVLNNPNGKSTYVLMYPRDLNKLMMVVNTSKGDLMREFCQILIDLFDLYQDYQNQYNSQQLKIKDKKIDKLINTMNEMNGKLDDIRDKNDELLDNNEELLKDNKKILKKLDISTDDRVHRSESRGKQEHFILIKLNREDFVWSYYVLRIQRRSINSRIKSKQRDFPNLEILVDIHYQPNSKNLFDRIQKSLRDLNNISVKGNYLNLGVNFTEENLLEAVRDIDEEKKVLPVIESDSD